MSGRSLFPPDPVDAIRAGRREGIRHVLDAAGWERLATDLGALGFPLFVAGVLCLVVWCWRRAGLPGRLMLLGVLVVASTSSSLGRKSNVLTVLVPAVLVSAPHGLARERPARDAAAIAAPRLRQAVPA